MSDNSLEISTSLEKDGLTTVVPAADMNSSNENATTSPSSMHRRRARASRANDGHDNEVSPSHHHAAVLVAHAASEVDSIYDHPSLTEEQKKMAIMLRNSRGKRSFVPILYFLAASLGKL